MKKEKAGADTIFLEKLREILIKFSTQNRLDLDTAYLAFSSFRISRGLAKDLLKELQNEGIIKYVQTGWDARVEIVE